MINRSDEGWVVSTLAKVRLIADSTNAVFWGSNPEEQRLIDTIREKFEPYLYADREKVPAEIMDELGPMAEEIFSDVLLANKLAECLRMYDFDREVNN